MCLVMYQRVKKINKYLPAMLHINCVKRKYNDLLYYENKLLNIKP